MNNKTAKALLQRVATEGYELDRSEFQLIHQSKKDMVKLIPFGFIFMILPESIPLFVIYAPGMIPSTCLTEKQIHKQREKLDKARQKMTANVLRSAAQIEGISPEDFLSRVKFQKIAKHYGYDFDLSRIDRRHLSSYCRFMGINDYGLQFMLKNRLEKHMKYLDQDDKLLVKGNYVDELGVNELKHAVEERGMRSIDEDEENMRRGLKYWLSLTQPTANSPDVIIPPGLLVFSRMFLLNAEYHGKQQQSNA
ncbi:MAG: LETM1-like protein-domain-containing protein [Benjaminiella poitrasii]|nr:MAG: LETM1-like protein-domain-containing protein [Benjaminiella poitrasii]